MISLKRNLGKFIKNIQENLENAPKETLFFYLKKIPLGLKHEYIFTRKHPNRVHGIAFRIP